MADEITIEQKIALFLETHNVTIVPETRGKYHALGYIQHTPQGMVDLGETVYEVATGICLGVPGEVAIKRHQLQGFVTGVTRPLARLLRETRGAFYEDDRWTPIHKAIERVEHKYPRQY